MTNEEVKKKLDCTARITGNELVKSALNIITVQEEEIDALKAENKQLKTECALLDDELRIARQETINVLNELRERIKTAIDTYFNKNGGGYYLAEDAIDDIDELINEVLNADKN